MKFSKHVETCFVRANDDFDDKLTYIYCFLNKKKLLGKNPQKRTLWQCRKAKLESALFSRVQSDEITVCSVTSLTVTVDEEII